MDVAGFPCQDSTSQAIEPPDMAIRYGVGFLPP